MLERKDILPLQEYETIRDSFRKKVLKAKEDRRLELGPNMTFLFENELTIQYQIQEMLRIEQKDHDEAIKEEWNAYEDLLPTKNSFSTTLLIQYPDLMERKIMLQKLSDLEKHLSFYDGDKKLEARWDNRQSSPSKISSVQFIQINITEPNLQSFKIKSTHPFYSFEVLAPHSLIHAINEDLNKV